MAIFDGYCHLSRKQSEIRRWLLSQKWCNTFKFYYAQLQTTRGSTENVQKLGVVVENFTQEGRKFSCLRYGGGWIACGVG